MGKRILSVHITPSMAWKEKIGTRDLKLRESDRLRAAIGNRKRMVPWGKYICN